MGLWGLDRAGGEAVQRKRLQLAAAELARKALRSETAAYRDVRVGEPIVLTGSPGTT
jgi:hypothetical protein